jgi:predicted MFS family arabinose efflux permease
MGFDECRRPPQSGYDRASIMSEALTQGNQKSGEGLGVGLMAVLACTGFFVGGVMHTHSPVLGAMAGAFSVDTRTIGWVATLTFSGYFFGLLFLVPLGDRINKRHLMLGQLFGLIAATFTVAFSESLWIAVGASFVIGACVCLTQNLIPIAVGRCAPAERGKVVGTVLTAMFLGFMFNRVASGIIGQYLGWRASFLITAMMLCLLAVAVYLKLPSVAPTTTVSYPALLRSILSLYGAQRALRLTSATQFFLAIGYGGFWAVLAPMLLLLHGMGPIEAGFMAIPGASGALISRAAGRWMDRRGARPVVIASTWLYIASFVVLGFGAVSIWAIIIGAALMDCGIRGAIVANSTLVASVDADARNRSNTIFGAHNWGGNSVGAFLASITFATVGWVAVCVMFIAAAAVSLVFQWKLARA